MGEIIGNELLTKNYLIETGFSIQKKFVIVDSSKFNDEAFNYIKELVDAAGSILFVSDTKKIYVHGRYFGGDIFQDDLLYYTNFVSYDNEGNIKPESESKIHNLLLKRGACLDSSSDINHLHNLWILDDKYTVFSNVFFAQSSKQKRLKPRLWFPRIFSVVETVAVSSNSTLSKTHAKFCIKKGIRKGQNEAVSSFVRFCGFCRCGSAVYGLVFALNNGLCLLG
jgi:hypothetical protein